MGTQRPWPGHRSVEVAVLHLVLAEAAEGQREVLAEAAGHHGALAAAEVQRMGKNPDAGLPEREDRSATAHQQSGALLPGAAADR
jgi:hypothetical protein